jgi:hypothetical protein
MIRKTTGAGFSDADRLVLAGLGDVLIPAEGGMPAASQAGVAAEGLDRVLAVCADLAAPLARLLEAARGREPAAFVAEIRSRDPAGFAALAETVAGAYFLNPAVRAALGYAGQEPRPIDPHPDWLDDGLLQSVIDRGPIYRPTPGVPGAR